MLNCRIIDFSFPQDILLWQANASTVSWYLTVTQPGKSDILMLGLFTMESDSIVYHGVWQISSIKLQSSSN